MELTQLKELKATNDMNSRSEERMRRSDKSNEFQLISFNQRKGLNSFNEINANGAKGAIEIANILTVRSETLAASRRSSFILHSLSVKFE